MYGWVCTCHSAHIEVRGQRSVLSFHFVGPNQQTLKLMEDVNAHPQRWVCCEKGHHENVHVFFQLSSHLTWGSHKQSPFLEYSLILLRAHRAHSQTRLILQPGTTHSAGFYWALCPVWRLGPCYDILFTTFITDCARVSRATLGKSSRQL